MGKTETKVKLGQVSLEMLLVLSFLLVFFVPLIIYVYTIANQDTYKLDLQQASAAASAITDAANRLFANGDGSITTISVYIPSRAKNVSAKGRELSITIDAPGIGEIDQVSVADVNLTLAGEWQYSSGANRLLLNYSKGTVYIVR